MKHFFETFPYIAWTIAVMAFLITSSVVYAVGSTAAEAIKKARIENSISAWENVMMDWEEEGQRARNIDKQADDLKAEAQYLLQNAQDNYAFAMSQRDELKALYESFQ